MKITRNQLRRLLAEQYQTLNEAAAKNWNEYIAAGTTQDSKKKRKQIRLRWDTIGGNKKLYPPDEVKSPSSPANFSNDYKGWTKWYFTCIKDAAAMKLINKSAGKHINPDEMLAVYSALIPASNLENASKMAKSEADKKIVDDFMSDLDFGGAGMSSSAIADLGKTSGQEAFDIIMNLEPYEKSGQTDLAAKDLSKYTSADDYQEPEAKVMGQTDPDARASTDIPVVGPDPDVDRSSTVGPPPKTRRPRRKTRLNRRNKNESAELTRNKIRRLIRESLKKQIITENLLLEHPDEQDSTPGTQYQVNVPPGGQFYWMGPDDGVYELRKNESGEPMEFIIDTTTEIEDKKFLRIDTQGALVYEYNGDRYAILKENIKKIGETQSDTASNAGTRYRVNVPKDTKYFTLKDPGADGNVVWFNIKADKPLEFIIDTKAIIDDRKFLKIDSQGDLQYTKGSNTEVLAYAISKANFKVEAPTPPKKPAIAKSWDAYVKSPLTGGKEKGVRVRDGWTAVCDADASFGDGSYKSWKSWYMKSIKDSALMATAGKEVGDQLSPEEVVKLYVGLIMITPELANSFTPSNITALSVDAGLTQQAADKISDGFNTALKKAPPAEKKKIKEKIAVFRKNIKAKFPKINFKSAESEGETSQAAKKKMTVEQAERTAENYVAGQTNPALFAVGVGRDKETATFEARQNFMKKQGKSEMKMTNTRSVKTYITKDGTVVVVLEAGEENLKESQERLSRGALYRRRYYGRY